MMGETVIQAWYQQSPVLEYAGNPLIEAMPLILSEENAAIRLAAIPPMPDEERELPKEIRLHCINRLAHLIQPLPIHLELEAAVSSILRGGYVGRNPMESSTMRYLHGATGNSSTAMFNSTASTFSLVGLSGMGKTTALKSVLRLYPQVIRHARYNGREFIHTQIVWLKLDCPHDGLLSGLCRAFFRAVDNALGDKEYKKYYTSKMGISELIQGMVQVAKTYFVGALFIDELQHLKAATTGGEDNMLNFFVNLINEIGIPVVFIGTNSMTSLFSKIMRNARRATGLGLYDFKQPPQDDVSWELLLNTMWQYQWVTEPVELSEGLRRQIYYYTQGVTDILAKLMILGQRYAIQSGREKLDGAVFKHVASTKMKLLEPPLTALRSNDPKRMARFEDLLPTDLQIEEMMKLDTSTASDRIGILLRQQGAAFARSPASQPQEPPQVKATGQDKQQATGSSKTREGKNVGDQGDRGQLVLPTPAQRPIPLSARLDEHSNVLELLRRADWILEEPFEFAPAYRVA
jgi:hypothetical protein